MLEMMKENCVFWFCALQILLWLFFRRHSVCSSVMAPAKESRRRGLTEN